MKIILFFMTLLAVSVNSRANVLELIGFDYERAKEIRCEPLTDLGIIPVISRCNDTTWIDFDTLGFDIYASLLGKSGLKQYFVLVSTDTSTVNLKNINSGEVFNKDGASENKLLYIMYFNNKIFPFEYLVTLDKLVTVKNKEIIIDVDVDKEIKKINNYVNVLYSTSNDTNLSNKIYGAIQQSFHTRMLSLYLLLNDHKYVLPSQHIQERKLYNFIDSIAKTTLPCQTLYPSTLTYIIERQEYASLKYKFINNYIKCQLNFMDDIISPLWTKSKLYKQPVNYIIQLYCLKKISSSKNLRSRYYDNYIDEIAFHYDTSVCRNIIYSLLEKITLAEKKQQPGSAVSGLKQILNEDGLKLPLQNLIGTKRGLCILVWASWCGRCSNAIQIYNTLAKQFNGEINFISLSIDKNPEDWHRGVQAKNILGTPYLDTDFQNSFVREYKIDHVPQLIILDNDLKIQCFGAVARNTDFYRELVIHLLE